METARRNRAFAEQLVTALVSQGLTDALVCPGSRNSPLVLALDAREDVAVQTVLDERAAGFVALGLGRVRGRAALVCCTSGSAAAHLLPAVVEAAHSRVPMIVLSADRPRELQSCGAPQTIDQTHLFGRHARWFFDFGAVPHDTQPAGWIQTIATQCWLRAHGEDAGPVHLNAPLAEPLWSPDLEREPSAPPQTPTARIVRGTRTLPDNALQELADRLAHAERGLIACGPIDPASLGGADGDTPNRLAETLGQLATTLGWPLIAEPSSQLRFCARPCPQLIGTADALARSAELRRALSPQLVLRIGQVPTSKALGEWLGDAGRGATILVDGGGRWHDPHHCADTIVVADPLQLSSQLVGELSGDTRQLATSPEWSARWREADAIAAEQLSAATSEGLWEPVVLRELLQRLPDGALLHVASSMPIRDLDTFGGSLPRSLGILSNRGANGIDGLLASAAGEALAAEGRQTALVCGDLAFLHDVGGLAAAAQLPLRLAVVVLDNGGGGIFEFLPIAAHPSAFRERFLTPQTTRPRDLCAAVGARYLKVETRAQLADALADALGHEGLAVLHVNIDRAQNVARHREAFDRTEQALATCIQRWEPSS